MSVAYDVYAEICIKGKWFGINPIIQDGDGEMVAVPILGWEQSWFRQSYEELVSMAYYCGMPKEMSAQLESILKPDEEIENYYGEKQIRREVENQFFYCIQYRHICERLNGIGREHQYSGYVRKNVITSFQLGDTEWIGEWLDERQYQELPSKEKFKYSFFEWDEESTWFSGFKRIRQCVENMLYYYRKHTRFKEFSYEDIEFAFENVRIVLKVS